MQDTNGTPAAAEAVLSEHARDSTAFVAEQDQPSPIFVVGESYRDHRLADSDGVSVRRFEQRVLF